MPRRNRALTPTKRQPPTNPAEANKVRYASRAAAERQIRERLQYQPELKLSTYQSPNDGGWYLTSR